MSLINEIDQLIDQRQKNNNDELTDLAIVLRNAIFLIIRPELKKIFLERGVPQRQIEAYTEHFGYDFTEGSDDDEIDKQELKRIITGIIDALDIQTMPQLLAEAILSENQQHRKFKQETDQLLARDSIGGSVQDGLEIFENMDPDFFQNEVLENFPEIKDTIVQQIGIRKILKDKPIDRKPVRLR